MASRIPQPQRSKIPRTNTSLGGRSTPQSRPATPRSNAAQGRAKVSEKGIATKATCSTAKPTLRHGNKEAPARLATLADAQVPAKSEVNLGDGDVGSGKCAYQEEPLAQAHLAATTVATSPCLLNEPEVPPLRKEVMDVTAVEIETQTSGSLRLNPSTSAVDTQTSEPLLRKISLANIETQTSGSVKVIVPTTIVDTQTTEEMIRKASTAQVQTQTSGSVKVVVPTAAMDTQTTDVEGIVTKAAQSVSDVSLLLDQEPPTCVLANEVSDETSGSKEEESASLGTLTEVPAKSEVNLGDGDVGSGRCAYREETLAQAHLAATTVAPSPCVLDEPEVLPLRKEVMDETAVEIETQTSGSLRLNVSTSVVDTQTSELLLKKAPITNIETQTSGPVRMVVPTSIVDTQTTEEMIRKVSIAKVQTQTSGPVRMVVPTSRADTQTTEEMIGKASSTNKVQTPTSGSVKVVVVPTAAMDTETTEAEGLQRKVLVTKAAQSVSDVSLLLDQEPPTCVLANEDSDEPSGDTQLQIIYIHSGKAVMPLAAELSPDTNQQWPPLRSDSPTDEKAVPDFPAGDDDIIEDLSDYSWDADSGGESEEEIHECFKIDKDDEDEDLDVVKLDPHFQPKGFAVGRKAKTIFSVDLPVPVIEGGPGENGDGCHQLFPHVKSSLSKQEQQMTELFMHPVRPEVSSVHQLSVRGSQPRVNDVEPTVPTPRKAGNKSAEEVMRKMNARGSCEAILSASSIMILKRTGNKSDVFRKSIQIQNSTSVLHGFKMFHNTSAGAHFSVTPSIGLVPPHSQVSVQVKTASPSVTSKVIAYDTLEVRTFPSADCSDPATLDDYYCSLKKHRPDLITGQRIERIVLWDAGDLMGMHQLLDKIQDTEQVETIKDELYSECAEGVLSEMDSKQTLHSSLMELQVTQQTLTRVYQEVVTYKSATFILLGWVVFCTSLLYILPYMLTEEVVEVEPEPVPEPELPVLESWYNWMTGFFA